MKDKGDAVIKRLWILFFVALILLVPFRFVQLLFWTEADTGFLTDGILSKSILFGGLLLALLLLIIMSARCQNFPKLYRPIKNFFVTAAALLAGAAVILKSIYEIYSTAVLGVQGASGTFTAGHPVFSVALSILGLFAAMMLFVTAGNFGSGRNTYRSFPLLALILPLWHCYNLIIQFVSTVSGASVAENALEVLTLVFALLFLFFQAKLFAGVEEARAARRCFLFGLPAILFAMSSSLPVCVMRAFEMPIATSFSLVLHLANLCTALYIFAFLAALTRAARQWGEAPAVRADLNQSDGQAGDRLSEESREDDAVPSTELPPVVPVRAAALPVSKPQSDVPQTAQAEIAEPPVQEERSPQLHLSFEDAKPEPEPVLDVPLQMDEHRARIDRIDRLYETLLQERGGMSPRSQEKK